MDFIGTLKENWAAVMAAPWAFVLVTALLGVGLWRVFEWRYHETIAKLKERVEHRDDDIAKLKGQVAEAQGHLTQRDGRIEALEADVRARDARIKNLEAAVKERDHQNETLTAEIADRDARLAALEAEVKSRDEKISAHEVEVFDLDMKRSQLEKELETARSELQGEKSRTTKIPFMFPPVEAPSGPKVPLTLKPRGNSKTVVVERKREKNSSSTSEPTSRSLLNPDGGRTRVSQLNPRQIQVLRSGLRASGGRIVIAKQQRADPNRVLQRGLVAAFTGAGWNVAISPIDGHHTSATGLALCVREPQNLTSQQAVVAKALRDAAIPYDLRRVDSEAEVSLWIME